MITVMRLLALSAMLLIVTCAGDRKKEKSESVESRFHRAEDQLIETHVEILRQLGRYPRENGFYFPLLGSYAWYSDGRGGYFGAYSFYPPAFEQAKRSWWINGHIDAGSDLLHALNPNAKFDESLIGYNVGYIHDGPTDAKVVAVVGEKTLRLDKKSNASVDQWGLSILPSDYIDMCNCHSNFTPRMIVPLETRKL